MSVSDTSARSNPSVAIASTSTTESSLHLEHCPPFYGYGYLLELTPAGGKPITVLTTLPDGTVAGLSLANPGELISEALRIAPTHLRKAL